MRKNIILILVLFFIWSKTRGGNTVLPSNWKPDLFYVELDAKAYGASMTFVDDYIEPRQEQEETYVVESEAKEIKESIMNEENERWPRVVILTDLKNCGPCIKMHQNEISKFEQPSFIKMGWTTGTTPDKMIEIVNIHDDPEKFDKYMNIISHFDPKFITATPTLVKISREGKIVNWSSGSRSAKEIMNFATKE